MSAPLPDQRRKRPFQPLGTERDHYWLVKRMAKATGVDLVRAMAEGHLTQATWADTVTRCRGCGWVAECDRWLDKDGVLAEQPARACPSSCENRARFRSLKRALSTT